MLHYCLCHFYGHCRVARMQMRLGICRDTADEQNNRNLEVNASGCHCQSLWAPADSCLSHITVYLVTEACISLCHMVRQCPQVESKWTGGQSGAKTETGKCFAYRVKKHRHSCDIKTIVHYVMVSRLFLKGLGQIFTLMSSLSDVSIFFLSIFYRTFFSSYFKLCKVTEVHCTFLWAKI